MRETNETVKHAIGLYSKYNEVEHKYVLYFAYDKKKIILNGIEYGFDITSPEVNLISEVFFKDNKLTIKLINGKTYIVDLSHTHLASEITDLAGLLNKKQNTLTPGDNISIINDVISAKLPSDAATKDFVNNQILVQVLNKLGVKSGIATLDENGTVPSSQLPSYVDDVIEGKLTANKFYQAKKGSTTEFEIFALEPESGKIYVDIPTNITYRWSGTSFVEISASLALGETDSTAYSGSKGKALATRVNNIEINKQDKLVSGTNIKTINNISLLGKGNIALGDLGTLEWAKISNKPAQAIRWPTWAEVTAKPNLMTLDTVQTVTATKIFGNHNRPLRIDASTGSTSVYYDLTGLTSGYAVEYSARQDGVTIGNFGIYGGLDGLNWLYMGGSYNDPLTKILPNGLIEARGGFRKTGSSDSYVLLGNGGTKLLSELNTTHKHIWNDITNKPATFKPELNTLTDWNAKFNDNDWGFFSGITNGPNAGRSHFGISVPLKSTAGHGMQLAAAANTIFFRTKANNVNGAWNQLWHTGNFDALNHDHKDKSIIPLNIGVDTDLLKHAKDNNSHFVSIRTVLSDSTSYTKNVTLLLPLIEENRVGHNRLNGTFFFGKTGCNIATRVDIMASCVYNIAYATIMAYGNYHETLCYVMYEGKKWLAINHVYHANPYNRMHYNGTLVCLEDGKEHCLKTINYYNEQSKTVLNQEIYDSIEPYDKVLVYSINGENIATRPWTVENLAPKSHNHAWSAITNKPAQATRWPNWTEVTSKPTEFKPAAHKHNPADINLNSSNRFVTDTEKSKWNTASANATKAVGWGDHSTKGYLTSHQPLTAYIKTADAETKYQPKGSYASASHSHAWSAITGKPSTFVPSAHTHIWNEITDKPIEFKPSVHSHTWNELSNIPVQASRWPTWLEVTGKPTSFAPSAHNHAWTEITGKPTTFAPSTHTHAWSQITGIPATATRWATWDEVTGKPTEFKPAYHVHNDIADIAGLDDYIWNTGHRLDKLEALNFYIGYVAFEDILKPSPKNIQVASIEERLDLLIAFNDTTEKSPNTFYLATDNEIYTLSYKINNSEWHELIDRDILNQQLSNKLYLPELYTKLKIIPGNTVTNLTDTNIYTFEVKKGEVYNFQIGTEIKPLKIQIESSLQNINILGIISKVNGALSVHWHIFGDNINSIFTYTTKEKTETVIVTDKASGGNSYFDYTESATNLTQIISSPEYETFTIDYHRQDIKCNVSSLLLISENEIDMTAAELIKYSSSIGHHFIGKALFNNSIYAPLGVFEQTTTLSDIRLKTNINKIVIEKYFDSLDKIDLVSFNWKKSENRNKQYGVIAQEVKQYLPELVTEYRRLDGNYLSVNYEQLIMLQIEYLKYRVRKLEEHYE